jgi:hypothetical protein
MQDPLHIEQGMRGKHGISSEKRSASRRLTNWILDIHKAGPVSKSEIGEGGR